MCTLKLKIIEFPNFIKNDVKDTFHYKLQPTKFPQWLKIIEFPNFIKNNIKDTFHYNQQSSHNEVTG